MNMTADVIIIGGAVMGVLGAWWLTRMQPGLRCWCWSATRPMPGPPLRLSVASIRQQFTTAVNVRISRFGH
jgi:FAD-dependent oxidoreductase domain-containing protein 1